MRNERRNVAGAAFAFACLASAACRPRPIPAMQAPSLRLRLTAPAADAARPLPRELSEPSLGLGMTLDETRLRLPGLALDDSLEFSAPPTYYVCDELMATHFYMLSRPSGAVALRARPARGGLESVKLYVLNGAIAALRGLYAKDEIRAVPFEEFNARALEKYGPPARSEALRYSDGASVRYTLWRNAATMILVGETDVPQEASVSRYIYFIDDNLLRDSYRASPKREIPLSQPVNF